jgi:hypothetical protein
MAGVEHEVVGKRQQPLGQRAIERARHVLHAVSAVGVKIRPADVSDQQGVAGQHQPRLVTARAVGHDVGVVRGGVTRRGEGLQLGVAQPHALAVGERVMVELDARSLRQIRPRARARHQLRKPRDVIGLHVRLEHGDDRDPLALGELEVLVHEIDVRIDDRERTLRLAAEQVRRARRVVVQELAEVHGLVAPIVEPMAPYLAALRRVSANAERAYVSTRSPCWISR